MLDARVRRALAPALDSVAGLPGMTGVSPLTLTAAGFVCGAGACLAIGADLPLVALALWLANRAFDGLDGPVARRRGATELGGFLDICADFAVYAGFVVGVAVAHPSARVACLFLLFAYYSSGTAFLALSSLLERRGAQPVEGRSLRFVGGLVEGTETVIAYCLFCLLPDLSGLIAWIFAAAVAITALQRVAIGARLLGRPGPEAADSAHPATPQPPQNADHDARDRAP